MNAKELRIGNLIDFEGQIETVYQIRNSGVDFFRGTTRTGVIFQSYVWEAINVIPLTEEWLLKFGFKLFSTGSYCKSLITDEDAYLALDLKYNYGFCWLNIKYGLTENTTKIHCNSVHQLQNLYFALTGEELTIKN